MNKMIRFTTLLLSLVLFLFVLSCTKEENQRAKQISRYMNYCYEKGIFNGVMLIAEDGQIIYHQAMGYADLENRFPLKTNTPFYIASLTKQFTSMAIMMLKERGKLEFDSKLSDFFPEFPSYAEQVTIRHLLTHTAGIPDHFELGAYKTDLTNAEVLDLLIRQPKLEFFPGVQFKYSNGNYVLLALIVERVSGESYQEFLRNNIFRPLGMNQTLVYDESKPMIDNRALGYNQFGEKDDYELLTKGAGGVFSTAEDLFKWDQALYSDVLVKPPTLMEAFTSYRLQNTLLTGYGFGWAVSDQPNGKIVSHGGGFGGFRAYIERQLNKNRTIIFMSNTGNALPTKDIIAGLRSILDFGSFDYPKIPISIAMQRLISEKGLQEALDQYEQLKLKSPDKYDFNEEELNKLGYHLLRLQKNTEAIAVFQLNVQAYPESANTYDSLGEAHMLNGDWEAALENYKRSLELDPDNSNARAMIQKIENQLP
jgi:CubicO group peptidase (beta-lactamase class C family)